MEILIFLLVISNLNLVLTEDVAIENAAAPKDSYQVRPEQENKDPNDQLAESSQSVGQPYGTAVGSDGFQQAQDETHHQAQASENPADAHVGHSLHAENGFRHDALALNPIQVLQSHQGYVQLQQPQHQLYLHPVQQIQVFDGVALPLHQAQLDEDPQALGYSSYIEHMSQKDEDELKSALQEGSVSDIKRLVPKSGISFKIYQSEKTPETQNPETDAPFGSQTPAAFSTLHHRIRNELPVVPLKAQPEVYQTSTLQPTALRNEDKEGYQNSQKVLQTHGQDQQAANAQTVYYAQPEAQKPLVDVNGKGSLAKPHFKINVAESNYNRQQAAAGVEVHHNVKYSGKSPKQGLADVNNQQQWNFNGKPEGLKAKPVETLQYAAGSLVQTEIGKGFPYGQNLGNGNAGQNFNKHRTENSFETGNHGSGSYISNSYITKTSQNHFAGQMTNIPHYDQKVVLNRLSGNYVGHDGIKPGQVIGHLGTRAHPDHGFKNGRFAPAGSETAKAGQHGLESHVPKSAYVETKNSQTFDHQKALEGSTSFDIKNAIDSSGSLIHQTNYVSPPTAEIHPLENVPKQQLTYIIPEIPTSTVVIENSIHDVGAEGHQIKDFGQPGVPPQVSYNAEVSGKYYHPSQNILWTSEHLKQGTSFTPKDHQQIIRLHLPKEEVFVKTSNVDFPTSVVSHVSIPQQKQPLVLHYELPFVKSFPQELHFQPKTKTRVQAGQHLKLTHPVTVDWSLFKSGLPNFGMNAVGVKHELVSHVQEPAKKIIPILVRKRKNRSNGKEIGVVYGKVSGSRRPVKPSHRLEKNVRLNVPLPVEGVGSNVKQFETKGERQNEFSVSASYKVDRSSKSS